MPSPLQIRNVAVVLVSLFSSLSALPQDPGDAIEKHFRAAQQAQQAGSLAEAAHEYQAVVTLDPTLAEAYANLGLVYYAESKFTESAAALSTANKLKPDLQGVTLWLGVDDLKLGRAKQAVPLLHAAVQRNPSDQQAQRWLGTALWDAGEIFAALDQMKRTSALFATDTDSLFVLGEAYRKAADLQVEEVMASATDSPLQHQIYGDIYRDQHSWTRATAHYQQASKADPSWKKAHLGLGEVYLEQDKLSEAKEQFEYELKIDPASAAAKAYLGEIALITGDLQGALTLFEQTVQQAPFVASDALKLHPEAIPDKAPLSIEEETTLAREYATLQGQPANPARSLAMAVIDLNLGKSELTTDFADYSLSILTTSEASDLYAQAMNNAVRGRYEEADQQLQTWLKSQPNDFEARYLHAQVLKHLSLQAFNHLTALDPDSPRVHQLLGQTFADRNEEDRALKEFQIVEHLDPTLPGIHYEIGHLLWTFGDRTKALEELNQELKINPSHAEANGEIGSILVVEEQPQKAIPYLESAIRIDPSLLLIHQQLGKAYLMEKSYKKAEQELLAASKGDIDGGAHYQLWVLYRAQGRTEAASKAIEECQRIRAARLDETREARRESALQ